MDDEEQRPLTLWEMLQSIIAAAFGVQSGKNRSRDFSRGKPSHFIILGLLVTFVFVLVLYALVRTVLYFAGV
ncbi:conserved protein of unknown function [Pseudomonas marincola]|uniref:DUF2970 domain-containing protein n=1 Tax=Pseudomonas marincola TaxID=437900 RepID=A0A653EAE2_9PSED|nr:DUF2970 domain-containing protein [Pseudomonas marincola]CAE6921372.1 conserved protein of unknown function [Pseudomonas marincola]